MSRHIIKITNSLRDRDIEASEDSKITLDRKTTNDELNFLVNKINDFLAQVSRYTTENKSQISLQKQKALYSARMASIGQMANGVAHEINNPLAIIYGFNSRLSRHLEKKNALDDEAKRMLDKGSEMVDRIAAIVRSLRFISQDASEQDYEIVNNEEILSQTLDLCREKFKARGISLSVECMKVEAFPCRGAQISQILLNLLYNSIDAVETIKDPWVKLQTDVVDRQIEFSVTDNGIGIPKENRRRIFEPFFSTKTLGKGSGLSLSICQGMAESHKGQFYLDIESSHTRFVLTLPVLGSNDVSDSVQTIT